MTTDGALSAATQNDRIDPSGRPATGAPGVPRSTGPPGTWREPADDAPLLRHERRSLALNAAVAVRIAEDPDRALRIARANLARHQDADQAGRNPWLASWALLLDGPLDEVLAVLASTTQEGRDLRQNSPFAGVLAQDERAAILTNFYRDKMAKVAPPNTMEN